MTTTATKVRVLGLDPVTDGWLAVNDGVVYLLTRCCKGSAKGTEHGVVCRSCYRPIADEMGMAWFVENFEAEYTTWLQNSRLTEGTPDVFAQLAATVAAQAVTVMNVRHGNITKVHAVTPYTVSGIFHASHLPACGAYVGNPKPRQLTTDPVTCKRCLSLAAEGKA